MQRSGPMPASESAAATLTFAGNPAAASRAGGRGDRFQRAGKIRQPGELAFREAVRRLVVGDDAKTLGEQRERGRSTDAATSASHQRYLH